jgi:hypothetical protein
MDISQAGCIPELAVTASQPQTGKGRVPVQAGNCPIHRIAVDILPSISFPVCIRHNPAYVLL